MLFQRQMRCKHKSTNESSWKNSRKKSSPLWELTDRQDMMAGSKNCKFTCQRFQFFFNKIKTLKLSQQRANCQTTAQKKRNSSAIQFQNSGFLSVKSLPISSEKSGPVTRSQLQSRAPKMLWKCFSQNARSFAPLFIASLFFMTRLASLIFLWIFRRFEYSVVELEIMIWKHHDFE